MNTSIQKTLDRLEALSYERAQLRDRVWQRIIPFAARKEYIRNASDCPDVTEEFLRNPWSGPRRYRAEIDWTILSPDADAVFVEVMIHWRHGSSADEPDCMDVRIPADVLFLSDDDFNLFWQNKRRAEQAAADAAARIRQAANEKAAETKRIRKEQRERKILDALKQKYEQE